jgi:hypothetical protein
MLMLSEIFKDYFNHIQKIIIFVSCKLTAEYWLNNYGIKQQNVIHI